MTIDADLGNPDAGPKLIVMVELEWPEALGEDPVRRCSRAVPPNYRGLTFDGEDYILDDFAFSDIRQSTASERVRIELSLQNDRDPVTGVERHWTAFSQGRELNGTEVRIHVAEASHLAEVDEIPPTTWIVSGYSCGKRLRLGLGPAHDALMLETPGVPLASQTCLWAVLGLYRRHPCNSTSELASCDGTLGNCIKRFPAGSALRMGPSFPLFAKGTRRRRT